MRENRISFRNIGDKLLVVIDFANSKEAEFPYIKEAIAQLVPEKAKLYSKKIYTLQNATNSSSTLKMIESMTRQMQPYADFQFVVGVSGFRRALLQITNQLSHADITSFDNEAQVIEFIRKNNLATA